MIIDNDGKTNAGLTDQGLVPYTNRGEFEELIRNRFPKQEDQENIMAAYLFSKYGHRGQMREGGGRYFEHPKAVAILLLQFGVDDADVIIAALLHDVLEDSFILRPGGIQRFFGSRAGHLVQMVTKSKDTNQDQDRAKAEYFRRLLEDDDPGSSLVKLADRLHNMSTLADSQDRAEHARLRSKKLKQVEETRTFILPLAQKLAADGKHSDIGLRFIDELTAWCNRRQQEAMKCG